MSVKSAARYNRMYTAARGLCRFAAVVAAILTADFITLSHKYILLFQLILAVLKK
ncbi:hypothetical protein AALC75_14150 [Lachnospiraceae bacterium 48-42]